MRSAAARRRWRADLGVVHAAGREIQADAAHARLAHGVQLALRHGVVDDGHAARVGPARLHPVEGGRVVRAVDARSDDDHALHAQRLVQRRHLLRQRHLRRVDASGEERKRLGVAVDVRVAIAGAARHLEAQGHGRLGCSGHPVVRSHRRSAESCWGHTRVGARAHPADGRHGRAARSVGGHCSAGAVATGSLGRPCYPRLCGGPRSGPEARRRAQEAHRPPRPPLLRARPARGLRRRVRRAHARAPRAGGEHPELVTSDSPTQRVSGQVSDAFATVEHLAPMLSLENATSEADLREFEARIKRVLPGRGFQLRLRAQGGRSRRGAPVRGRRRSSGARLAATAGSGRTSPRISGRSARSPSVSPASSRAAGASRSGARST